MKRVSTPSFVHKFALAPASRGYVMIDRVEDHARRLYNAVLGDLRKKLFVLKKSAPWQAARLLPKKSQERILAFENLRLEAGLSEFHAHAIANQMRNAGPDFIQFLGTHVAQKLASRAWDAIEKLLYAKAKRVRFKKKNEFFSFEGKNNETFVRDRKSVV